MFGPNRFKRMARILQRRIQKPRFLARDFLPLLPHDLHLALAQSFLEALMNEGAAEMRILLLQICRRELCVPPMTPAALRIGEMVRETSMRLPPLRARTVS
jgi:hypothetical protein